MLNGWRRRVAMVGVGLLACALPARAQITPGPGGGGGGGFSLPAGWTWDTNTLQSGLASDGGEALRRNTEPLDAVLNIFDNGTATDDLLDIMSDDGNTYLLYMWNRLATAQPAVSGLAVYQGNRGDLSLTANGFGVLGWIPPQGSIHWGSDVGLVVSAMNVTEHVPDGDAPAIGNVGTPGANTVTYQVIGTTVENHVALSADGTTTTANATLDMTNYNTVDMPGNWSVAGGGYREWRTGMTFRVYRTVGGATQGLIATGLRFTDFPLQDTGLVGDSMSPPSVNTTGRTLFYEDVDAGSHAIYVSGLPGVTVAVCTQFTQGLCTAGM